MNCGMVRKNKTTRFAERKYGTWYDDECRQYKSIIKRQIRALQKHGYMHLHAVNEARRKYKSIARTKKRLWQRNNYESLLESLSNLNSRTFWELLDDKSRCATNKIAPSDWYSYFHKLYEAEPSVLFVIHNSDCNDEILDVPINESEVECTLAKAKSKKACGFDGIPAEVWKSNRIISNVIYKILHRCYEECIYPNAWRFSIIVPVYKKKGDPSNPDNYRGISLITSLAKVFSDLLCSRLKAWADNRDFFMKTQSGYQNGKSCIDNIFILYTTVSKYVKKENQKLRCVFVDFQKAFDYVDRQLLWHKMICHGFSPKFVKMLQVMYDGLTACIRCNNNGQRTDSFLCNMGLRQGDSLSALLFLCYINDLERFFADNNTSSDLNLDGLPISLMMLADDMCIIDKTTKGLQHKLNTLKKYCSKYRLLVNTKKTQVMVFGRKSKGGNKDQCKFDDKILETIESYNYLGFTVSNDGKYMNGVDTLIRKAHRAQFMMLSKLQKFGNLEPRMLMKIFDVKILPIALYGCEVWGSYEYERVEIFVSNFYRTILGLKKNAPTTLVWGELGRLPTRIKIFCRTINYWIKIVQSHPSSALKHCYNTQLYLTSLGIDCWGMKVRKLLQLVNLEDVWDNQNTSDLTSLAAVFKSRLISMEKEVWNASLLEHGNLRTYRQVKNLLCYEKYLDVLNGNRKLRNVFIRLRGGLLPIEANTGRWNGVPYLNRICGMCNSGAIEDEYHVLFVCRALSTFRLPLLQHEQFRTWCLEKVLETENRRMLIDVCVFILTALDFRNDVLTVI
jgi:hypothetical protein